jgi:hypothetical protein
VAAEGSLVAADLPTTLTEKHVLNLPAVVGGPRSTCRFQIDLQRVDAQGRGERSRNRRLQLCEVVGAEERPIVIEIVVGHEDFLDTDCTDLADERGLI